MNKPPNVLMIVCDQLNAAVMSTYGGPVHTPHIDRLAERGVVFSNATCPAVLCSPSRASIVTGLYPHAHGILHNVGKRDYPTIPRPDTEEGIKARDITTEKILSELGYATHHYGKWHLSDEDLPYFPDPFGEHRAYADDMSDAFRAVRDMPRETWMDWYGWALPVDVSPDITEASGRLSDDLAAGPFRDFVSKIGHLRLPLEQTFDAMIADRTIERLKNLGSGPFMMTASFNSPHDPNTVPSPYYELFNPADVSLPGNTDATDPRFENDPSHHIYAALGERGLREFLRIYYGAVTLVDDQVGRILDALESTGRADETVVVFLADHGDMTGGHGMVWKSTTAFYDEIVRVPLIISYPEQIAPGRVDDVSASLVDLMPTLLDLAGAPIPDHVQGRSLKPSLTGDAAAADGHRYSFCERLPANPGHRRQVPPDLAGGSYMVRSPEWKYLRYPDGGEYLYHLSADPGESVDLSSDEEFGACKRYLSQQLDTWLAAAARA